MLVEEVQVAQQVEPSNCSSAIAVLAWPLHRQELVQGLAAQAGSTASAKMTAPAPVWTVIPATGPVALVTVVAVGAALKPDALLLQATGLLELPLAPVLEAFSPRP